MGLKRTAFITFLGLLLAVQLLHVSMSAAEEGTADSGEIDRLEHLIEEQQQQLDSLQEQLNEFKETATDAQIKVVTSGQDRVKLAISGQVHRAINIVDDGKSTRSYFVDVDNTNSRVRFIGTATVTDDMTIGAKFEVAIAPNESSEVSQEDQEINDFIDQRWAEVSLHSKRFGKLSLGKGDTASNNSAEVDLSRTDVIQYASVADIVGGMLFRQKSSDILTIIRVSDAFKDFDGLSRKSRVRYDTPTLYGFRLAASAVSDQRYDVSLWWGGHGFGFKAAGAVAVAYLNGDDSDYQYDGSFSLLHEATGLNLTLSAGVLDRTRQDNPSNVWGKAGWLTRFFSVGETAFGVDYGRSENLPTENDDGYSYGAAVVQQLENYGTEFYAQYRIYSLDRGAVPDVHDMHVGTFGARVKF